RKRIRREARWQDPRDGAPQSLQASHAADREAEPAHRRPRLSVSPRLGERLSRKLADAGSTETLSTRRGPPGLRGPLPIRRFAPRGPSPAPLRLGLGYMLALAGASSFG